MDIKEQIFILVKLQKIETEVCGLESTLNNVDRKYDALDAELREFEQNIDNEVFLLDELKKQYRLYESDVQMNLEQVKKSQASLRTIKTNREYQSLLKQIDEFNVKNVQIEDEMLEFLDRMDKAESNIAAKKNEYSMLEDRIMSDKEIVKQETEHGNKRLAQLNMDFNDVFGMITPELLDKYEMVKKQKGGTAIVPVNDAVCGGCNMNIPPQMYNELQRCDSLMFCPNCQRMIYWQQ
ncbi:MAG: C4-type zinc ribbon domain-containing protein [Thermodesulfobacteriota bacterium]|nr:C4-type zinc ribbon domain-containing protein [Thermodesulfobacteriota bacterium]